MIVKFKQFSRGQIFYQSQVGLEEIQPEQFLPRHPANFAKDSILNFSLAIPYLKKSQFDRSASWILMDNTHDLFANVSDDPELFLKFAAHRIARLFAFFDLASRKLPF